MERSEAYEQSQKILKTKGKRGGRDRLGREGKGKRRVAKMGIGKQRMVWRRQVRRGGGRHGQSQRTA